MVEVQPEHEPFYKSGSIVLLKESTDTLKLLNPNAVALSLGDSTHEGGNIEIYRDASGNLAFGFDADAASNAKGADFYAGVVCQNYLTVGQTALNTSYQLYVNGIARVSNITCTNGITISGGSIDGGASQVYNVSYYRFIDDQTDNIILQNITDAAAHSQILRIGGADLFSVKVTGNGSGGVDAASKAFAFFGGTPQVQQNHIIDADGNLADITTKFNTLLAGLEGYGILKSA